MDRRRELQQYRYLGRDTPEDAGFVEEGNFLDGRRLVYNTANGYKFRASFQTYTGHVIECPELGIRQTFSVGTRWSFMAAWIDAKMATRQAA